jgi:hypothetical protein
MATAATETPASTVLPTQPVPASAPIPEDAVSDEWHLLLGALNLADTELAVTPEQAEALIPLWSDFETITTQRAPTRGKGGGQGQPRVISPEAQMELNSLTAEMQAAMTAEQLQAIAAMIITPETAMSIVHAHGLNAGGPGGQSPQPP